MALWRVGQMKLNPYGLMASWPYEFEPFMALWLIGLMKSNLYGLMASWPYESEPLWPYGRVA